ALRPPAPVRRLGAAQLGRVHDAEPHLERHLELADPAVAHRPPHLLDLEPIEALQRLAGARDRILDRLIDVVRGDADELDQLVRVVGHSRGPPSQFVSILARLRVACPPPIPSPPGRGYGRALYATTPAAHP